MFLPHTERHTATFFRWAPWQEDEPAVTILGSSVPAHWFLRFFLSFLTVSTWLWSLLIEIKNTSLG